MLEETPLSTEEGPLSTEKWQLTKEETPLFALPQELSRSAIKTWHMQCVPCIEEKTTHRRNRSECTVAHPIGCPFSERPKAAIGIVTSDIHLLVDL